MMVYFIGAGPGDAKLVTVKAKEILQEADVVLYTGSLVPKEVIGWAKRASVVKSSQDMDYDEIFEFLLRFSNKKLARVHTGDPSLYSTIAKQIEFLRKNGIDFEVIPGVTAAFGASASLGIEWTIPGVSQTLILSRIEGRTPQPEKLENLLRCKNSSFAFYLSISLIKKLKDTAYSLGYSKDTPCWVVEKATWSDERVYKGSLQDIESKVSHIKGIALILMGEFLHQKEKEESHLYAKKDSNNNDK